jgi:hypothetical protein
MKRLEQIYAQAAAEEQLPAMAIAVTEAVMEINNRLMALEVDRQAPQVPLSGDNAHPCRACRDVECDTCGPVLHQLAHEIEDTMITRLHEATEREGLWEEMNKVSKAYNRLLNDEPVPGLRIGNVLIRP